MGSLPTCWYCPECGISIDSKDERVEDERYDRCRARYRDDCGVLVEVPIIPPGTPLTDILDAFGIPYRESREAVYPDGDIGRFPSHKPVLVVDNLATDEAHDG